MAVPRFWLTAALCLAAAVVASLPLIMPGLGTAPAAPLWPLAVLAALGCWLVDRWRWPARLILFGSTVAFGQVVFHSSYPKTTDESGETRIYYVDRALAAVEAASWTHGILLVLLVAAFICSCGRVRAQRISGRSMLVAAAILTLVVAAAVPAGLGVRSASRAAIRDRAETITRYDSPPTDDVKSDVRVGKKHGWSRTGLENALPAGTVTIGIRGNTVVGLRTRDGAKLWQYRVEHDKHHDWINDVVVDPGSHTVLVRVRRVLIGISFDGRIAYHSRLTDTGWGWTHPHDLGPTTGGRPDREPTLSRASTAVFARSRGSGDYVGRHFAYGYSESNGRRLWHADAGGDDCELTATTHGDSSYVFIGGMRPPCRSRILRFDGPTQQYDTELKPPSEQAWRKTTWNWFVNPGHRRINPPFVQVVDADFVATQSNWARDSGHTKDRSLARLIDSAGTIRKTRSTAPLSGSATADSLLFAVQRHGGQPRFGMLDTDHAHHRLGWVLFDENMHKKSTVWLSGPEYPKIRQIGEHYLDLIDHSGRHHIRRLDDQLSAIDTITEPRTHTSKKYAQLSAWAAGDNDHLVLGGGGDTITVRPIT